VQIIYIYIHDIETDTREWKSGESSGPFLAIVVGDINNDQVGDQVYASVESRSGSGDGIVTAVDGKTGEILWSTASNAFGGHAWTGLHDLEVADINGDGSVEILVATDRLYDGSVYVLNSTDGSVESHILFDAGSPIYSLKVVDIDDDGDVEILAGGGTEHTGAKGNYVYVIDGKELTWTSPFPSINTSWNDIWLMDTIDFDGDGSQEIIILQDQLYIIDPDNNGLISQDIDLSSMAVTVDIFTGDALLYAGTPSGYLLDVSSNGVTSSIAKICDAQIDSLEAISPVTLAFTCNGRLALYDVVGKSVEWQSENKVDPSLGLHDRLIFSMINGKRTLLASGQRISFFTETTAASIEIPNANSASFSGHFSDEITGILTAEYNGDENLVFGVYKQPTSGRVEFTDENSGEFVYIPNGRFVGSSDFQFYVSNGSVASNIATVNLELENQQPIGESTTNNIHWNQLVLSTLIGSDGDNDLLEFEIVDQPNVGVLTLLNAELGTYSYANKSANATSAVFTYRINDGGTYSDTYSVTLFLNNIPPIAVPITLETYYSIDISTMIKGKDIDNDEFSYDVLKYELLDEVTNLTLSENGLLSYQGNGTSSYSISANYRVFDGREWSAPGKIIINLIGEVVPGYKPVYITYIAASKYVGVGALNTEFSLDIAGGSGAYDYKWNFGDGESSLEAEPSHTYQNVGNYSVEVTITDREDAKNIAKAYIEVIVIEPISDLKSELNVIVWDALSRIVQLELNLAGANKYRLNISFGDGSTTEIITYDNYINIPYQYLSDGIFDIEIEVVALDENQVIGKATITERVTMKNGAAKVGGPASSGGVINLYWLTFLFISLLLSRRK
jgi:PKD domain/FG-GAP-like repeat/Bacterial Ig domain